MVADITTPESARDVKVKDLESTLPYPPLHADVPFVVLSDW